jgi:hypothetical protein
MKRQFERFQEMQQKGMSLNSFSFVPVLNAYSSLVQLCEALAT